MRKTALALTLLLLAQYAQATEAPLQMDFRYAINHGIDRIDVLNAEGNGVDWIYAVNNNPSKTTIYTYTLDGTPVYDTTIPKYSLKDYGSEEFVATAANDLDNNGFLDIITATEIRTSSINNHPLYRIQRIPEEGLIGMYNRMVWVVKDSGRVTSINFINIDGRRDILTSSVDNEIRGYNKDGNVTMEMTFNGSVWHATPYEAGNETLILAACYRGLYLMDVDGQTLWAQPTDTRYEYTAVADMDGSPIFLGTSNDTIYAYDSVGAMLFERRIPKATSIIGVHVPQLDRSYILVGADDTLLFLNRTGDTIWENNVGDSILSLKTYEKDGVSRIYVGTKNGIFAYHIDDSTFKAQLADEYYASALTGYERGEFDLSAQNADKATQLYTELIMPEKQSKAEALLAKAERLNEAVNLLTQALDEYDRSNYNLSGEYAMKAYGIFMEMNYSQGWIRSGELIKKSDEMAKTTTNAQEQRAKADGYYDTAEVYYVNGSYRESIQYAKLALDVYRSINHETGVRLAETLIKMDQDAMPDETTTTLKTTTTTKPKETTIERDDIITYGALILAVAVLATAIITKIKNRGPTS